MKKLLLSLFISTLLPNLVKADILDHWSIEAESPETSVATLSDSIIDIVSPKGMTLWYNERMEGNTIIEYDARIVVEDKNSEPWNRLSDLNCFWMANHKKLLVIQYTPQLFSIIQVLFRNRVLQHLFYNMD